LAYLATRRLVPWRIPWLSVGRIVLAAAAMGVIMFAIGSYLTPLVPIIVALIAAGIVGVPVYIGVLILTRELKSIKPGSSS